MWILGAVGRFGHAYKTMPEWIYFLHLLVLAIAVVSDQNGKRMDLGFRTRFLIISILASGATVAGYFLYISPIGAEVLYAFQGRYLTPYLPFLFLGFFYIPLRWGKPELIKWAVFGYCLFIGIYICSFIESSFYLSE